MKAILIILVVIILISLMYILLTGGESSQHYRLYQLQLGSQIDGSFFLGCGDVESRPVFYYYTDAADKEGKVLRWASTKFSTIYEDADEPYLIITTGPWYTTRCFHIPPNSIMPHYDVNLDALTR